MSLLSSVWHFSMFATVVAFFTSDFCKYRPTFNAHPNDCSKFVICLSGKVAIRRCDEFPMFDASSNLCRYFNFKQCKPIATVGKNRVVSTTRKPTTTTTTTKPITKATTIYKGIVSSFCLYKSMYNAHPTDCKKYIVCIAGRLSIRSCPRGLSYEASMQRCVFNYLSSCHKGSRISSTTTTTTVTPQIEKFKPYIPIAQPRNRHTTLDAYSWRISITTVTPQAKALKPKPKPLFKKSRNVYNTATPCSKTNCKLPECYCSGIMTPNNMPAYVTPKMILFTMDDNVNSDSFNLYSDLLDKLQNPNGCPVKATFFVSGDFNNYPLTKRLFDKGHEIAVHTISHKTPTTFWKTATYEQLVKEIIGMRTKLESFGIRNIKGYRNPFLQTAGDTTFSVLKDYGFLYDSTLPTALEDNWWPYTLEYDTSPNPCVIHPCPTKSYPGLWEVPLISQTDGIATCSMFDGCHRYPKTEQGVYSFFKSNFEQHFRRSTAPFPMYGHAAWMMHPAFEYRKKGITRFINELVKKDETYFVSVTQAIEWMKQPTALHSIRKDRGPLSC